ncbi:ytcJ, partial [Symbiodinium necroappetens]
ALELGGALKCLPGAGGFRDALFGGCYVVGEPVDVLMRAELGPMPGEEAKTARASREELCRIAVRSTSHLVNRGVAQDAEPLLLFNAHILSVHHERVVINNWLHVKGGIIQGIGPGEPPPLQGKKLDLEGRTVLPGLADSHLHVFALGKADAAVSLGDCKSIADLQKRTREHLEEDPPLKLLEGMGWDQDLLGRIPNKGDLDACIPDTPAVFYRRCHHVCVLNSAALRKCGITSETPDPDGGVIERDAERQPTGVLKESALTLHLESLKEEEPLEREKAVLLRGLKLCVENGVTFVQSNDGKTLGGIRRPFDAYASLADEGRLPCRIFLTIEWQAVGEEGMPKSKASHPSGLLSCDRAKIWTDGGLGASTAAMLEPYADNPSNSGVMQMTRPEIDSTLALLKKHGFRVEAHAIGDRAATDLVDAFEKLMPGSQRPVLTHCQFLNRDLVSRMSKLGIIANVQPQFVPSDLPIVKARVGEATERYRYAYVWKTLMKSGVRVAGGSDAPVESPTPLIGMADAMEHALFESERMSFAEALSMYTTEAAYAAWAEDRLGSLEEGKQADFIVLSLRTKSEPTAAELRSATVEKVFVQGRQVHDQSDQNERKRRRLTVGDAPGKDHTSRTAPENALLAAANALQAAIDVLCDPVVRP